MRSHPKTQHRPRPVYHFGSAGEGGRGQSGMPPAVPDPVEGEDLPFKVELWDHDKKKVELVLAVTASGSIGYAAYFAATREYPARYITLRHKDRFVSRWNGPAH